MNAESITKAGVDQLLATTGKSSDRPLSFSQQLYQCFSVAALAMASYFVISHYVLQTVQVVGASMVPTLRDSQKYLLNRWVYHFRSPKRSDVVVLRDPIDNGFAVKRIIGTSGDWIYLKNGQVFVNGHKLNEPYLAPGTPTFPYKAVPAQVYLVGRDEFFVLGDNRKNSADSRTYGAVPRRNILGLIVR